jgi:glycosyltransferase involved in cell wall biosynthesis
LANRYSLFMLMSYTSAKFKINKTPTVSIGMFVYNNESTLETAIESLLSQSYCDFELIISDDASTDGTGEICQKFASIDNRIRYIRQPTNLGGFRNLLFVLDQSVGSYFMWAAGDDTRTAGFIEKNIDFLEKNPDFACCSSPNCWETEENQLDKHIRFELCGELYERLIGFWTHALYSHACFYSLIRKEVLKDLSQVKWKFVGTDWYIMQILLSKGKFGRTRGELIIFGKHGESNDPRYLEKSRVRKIEYFIPLFEVSRRSIRLVNLQNQLTKIEKLSIILRIVWYNFAYFLYLYRDKIFDSIQKTV